MFLSMKVFDSCSRDLVIFWSTESGASDHAVWKYLKKDNVRSFCSSGCMCEYVCLFVCLYVWVCIRRSVCLKCLGT